MNKRFFFIAIIICLLGNSVYSVNKLNSPDVPISEIYLKNSYEQYKADNYKEALSLINIALSFSNESSDALFIRTVAERMLEISNISISGLQDAIIIDNWHYFNELTARVYLSKFLFFNGNTEEAYLNLIPFVKELSDNSYFTELFIRIALSLGKVEQAKLSAANRIVVDPYDNYSQQILVLYEKEWVEKANAILQDGDPLNYFSKNVVQTLIRIGGDNCILLREFYLKRWGSDRFYKISSICDSIDKASGFLKELYVDDIILDYKELLWIYKIIENDAESIQALSVKLNSLNFTIVYDSDNDGYNDTSAVFSQGKLLSFDYDSNNDGQYNYLVKLSGIPVSLKIVHPDEISLFYYKNYPNLSKVSVSNNEKNIEYQLIPYKLSLDSINIPKNMFLGIPKISTNYDIPDNDTLTAFSSLKVSTNNENNLIANYFKSASDESIEKIFNTNGVKILERHYENSVLITVFKDFDNDGVFDTVYEYINGILKTVSFDENNNGVFEYLENYENGILSSWDFNEDGLIDSREIIRNGIIYHEMSSGMDGVFDSSVEVLSDDQ